MLDHVLLRHVLPLALTAVLQFPHVTPCDDSLAALDPEVAKGKDVHSFQTEHEKHFGGPS